MRERAHCSLRRLSNGLNGTHFGTKSQLVEAAKRFDVTRGIFCGAFHCWLSQWSWFAGRPLRPGIGMDRCAPLYLWNQCDRMGCLLRRSEANTMRKNGQNSAARPYSGLCFTPPNHPSDRRFKLARHYDSQRLCAAVYRPILVAKARGAHSARDHRTHVVESFTVSFFRQFHLGNRRFIDRLAIRHRTYGQYSSLWRSIRKSCDMAPLFFVGKCLACFFDLGDHKPVAVASFLPQGLVLVLSYRCLCHRN